MKGNDEGSGTAASAARAALVRSPAWTRGTVALVAVTAAVALGLSACGGGPTNSQGVAALPRRRPSRTFPGQGPPAAKEWQGLARRRRRALLPAAL
jgi:hypothetical protein